jgi:hypothetical protein
MEIEKKKKKKKNYPIQIHKHYNNTKKITHHWHKGDEAPEKEITSGPGVDIKRGNCI